MAPTTTIALAKETQQGVEVITVGAGLDYVGLCATREPGESNRSVPSAGREVGANGVISRVDQNFAARFHVAEANQPRRWPVAFAGIRGADSDQVMLAGGTAKGSVVIGAEKVANGEYDRATALNLHDIVDAAARSVPVFLGSKARMSRRSRRTCRGPLLGGTNRSTSDENATSPTRSLLLTAQRANSAASSAAAARLVCKPGAEPLARGHVHDQQEGQFPLLDVPLDERVAGPRGHVPVDGSHVVAGLVLANLLEREPGPLERRVVLPAQERLHQPTGAEMEAANLPQDIGGEHAS